MQLIEIRKDAKVLHAVGVPQSENIIEQTIPLIYIYDDQKIQLGELYVIASLKGVYDRILDRVLVILSIQTIKTFLVSLFIFVIFYQLVGKFIISMASFVESIHFESLDQPLQLDRKPKAKNPDELDQLVTSFNRMQENLGRDIIRRKIAEKELQESEMRYHNLYDNAPDMYVSVSPNDASILNCNETLLHKTGYSREEVIGSPIFNIYHENCIDEVKKAFQQFVEIGIIKDKELILKRKNGSKIDVSLNATSITDDTGKIQYSISSWRDITERKKMEVQLHQAQKMESIGNLAGGIAHDFNNLLYPIIGFAEMLKEDLPPESSEHENAQEIFNAGKRGGELVKQILAFSRQSDHKLQPVRIQKILNEVLKLTRSSIPSDIEMHQDIQPDCGSVMAEATQLHQISMNLITNAYHAVEEASGTISVQLKEIKMNAGELKDSPLKSGKYAMLSISDNGSGIPRNLINNIFEPYFTTKEKGKGTGLGLAVVYGIVKEHKGDIKVYSEEGKGTTFNVYIPLMKKTTGTTTNDPISVLPTGTESLLLVDDEKSVVRLEKQILERLGYNVVTQSSSIKALEVFKSNPNKYDLVITDMTMPGMTGDKLAKEILSIKLEMPIIICTGFSERINKEQADDIGVNGFLMKPVVKSEMAQMVRKVLDDA